MKYFIIITNVLLITLILYNLFSYGNTVLIENLENNTSCPKDQKNKVYQHEAKIERLFSEINSLNYDSNKHKKDIEKNKSNIKKNESRIKGTITSSDNKRKEVQAGADKIKL
tara:strand:- start:682 stop:1017 length:336 start_codon:yes stop_codon:yes gene_type:complete